MILRCRQSDGNCRALDHSEVRAAGCAWPEATATGPVRPLQDFCNNVLYLLQLAARAGWNGMALVPEPTAPLFLTRPAGFAKMEQKENMLA